MVEQGDVLKVEGINFPVVVVSNNRTNTSNQVIVCPIMQTTDKYTLIVPIDGDRCVISDKIKQLDLNQRSYSVKSNIGFTKVMMVVDQVQAMLDYF